jgi:tetratricopeptide (TPR) repeat protein
MLDVESDKRLSSQEQAYAKEIDMNRSGKEDHVKVHREGTALCDSGNYKAASDKFLKASKLYENVGDFFDSAYTLFKAAECSFFLKDYDTATEWFLEAADKMFERGFDRFALGALEYANDCYKATGKEKSKKATDLKKKIRETKERLESQTF